MDRQVGSIGPYLKLPFQLICIAIITIVFASGCIVTGAFSKHASQMVCRTWARLVLNFLGVRLHRMRPEKNYPRKTLRLFLKPPEFP